jgi:hypothetical protein
MLRIFFSDLTLPWTPRFKRTPIRAAFVRLFIVIKVSLLVFYTLSTSFFFVIYFCYTTLQLLNVKVSFSRWVNVKAHVFFAFLLLSDPFFSNSSSSFPFASSTHINNVCIRSCISCLWVCRASLSVDPCGEFVD